MQEVAFAVTQISKFSGGACLLAKLVASTLEFCPPPPQNNDPGYATVYRLICEVCEEAIKL